MIAVGVVDWTWRVRSMLDGWWRVTGVRRSEWERGDIFTWLHPDDWPALRRMGVDARACTVTRRLRLGHWDVWSPCIVELGPWTADGAPIAIRSLPQPERCAMAVTDATRYLHVDSAAEAILEAPALAVEGAPWAPRIHQIDVRENAQAIADLCAGVSGIYGMLVLLRGGGRWKAVKSWAEPIGHGQTVTWFSEVALDEVLGRPLRSMLDVGMARPLGAEAPPTPSGRTEA